MKIAVLSGKGGTGKTTVSTNLAFISKLPLFDTDIEEPNSHIFLKNNIINEESVYMNYPKIHMEKCNLCGECGDFCKFNAVIPARNTVLVFEESCHDCGGCGIICKQKAISWEKREIGKIFTGKTYFDSDTVYGKLNIGEMSGVRIIKKMYKDAKYKDFLIDCPPGTACTTVAAVEEADFAIIVTEPSPFGLSDMKLVVKLLKDIKIPFGIVVNKAEDDETELKKYCLSENITILGEIPFSRKIAENYSKGEIISDVLPEYRKYYENIWKKVKNYGN
ncbi:ATP-binding protein [Fusobacterium perfoetens]|uniref:P-loop NTPase n=1 Tax=Fusobacterium perfoetens TaxID=852 RepID=UPI001F1E99AF|nr:ATP-binding protein [Fusobacterium perfoetens]MCF2626100.1 ATP-binding protein [Fusobacterium perfoetens]